jgi:hypothetical protein
MHWALWVFLTIAVVVGVLCGVLLGKKKHTHTGSSSSSSNGITGPTGAAAGTVISQTVATLSVTGAAFGSTSVLQAHCPTGYVALGGGALVTGVTSGFVSIIAAVPTGAATGAPDSFFGQALVTTGTAAFYTLQVNALCSLVE